MSKRRTTVRGEYDAVVDLGSTPEQGSYVYALVKRTYTMKSGGLKQVEAEPLFHDLRDEDLEPRIVAGTDFWDHKEHTDFVVLGTAFAPGGVPVTQQEVSVRVGDVEKRLAVFGKRTITWGDDGAPHIDPTEPFTEMPLTAENAYGGIDWRVTLPEAEMEDPLMATMLEADHPGLYPRNPFGKGYLVEPGEVPEMEAPNLEDPDDLLTPERLIVKDPRDWYKQPLPWHLDWVHPVCFPRNVHFAGGMDAWFEGPEDEGMPEVARGFLMPNYRQVMEARSLEQGPHPRFYQEASHGMVLPSLQGGEPVQLTGMHPEQEVLRCSLPRPPELRITIEGDEQAVQPRLHHVVCFPDQKKVTMVWGGIRDLTRTFIPGIHKHIPISISVDRDAPVPYDTPPTLKDQIAQAEKEAKQATKKPRRRRARKKKS